MPSLLNMFNDYYGHMHSQHHNWQQLLIDQSNQRKRETQKEKFKKVNYNANRANIKHERENGIII